jgi:hypothetical protein
LWGWGGGAGRPPEEEEEEEEDVTIMQPAVGLNQYQSIRQKQARSDAMHKNV